MCIAYQGKSQISKVFQISTETILGELSLKKSLMLIESRRDNAVPEVKETQRNGKTNLVGMFPDRTCNEVSMCASADYSLAFSVHR